MTTTGLGRGADVTKDLGVSEIGELGAGTAKLTHELPGHVETVDALKAATAVTDAPATVDQQAATTIEVNTETARRVAERFFTQAVEEDPQFKGYELKRDVEAQAYTGSDTVEIHFALTEPAPDDGQLFGSINDRYLPTGRRSLTSFGTSLVSAYEGLGVKIEETDSVNPEMQLRFIVSMAKFIELAAA